VLATEGTQDPIIEKVKNTKEQAQNGIPDVVQQNYLFHGPPGTGKTLRAQKIARECNMDFAVMTGASLFKFDCAQALAEIDNLFKHAQKNPNGTVIVIDEAESLLLDRNTLAKNSMEYKVVNHLLSYLGTKTPNIVLVMTTNHPKLLDKAVQDRIDDFVEMGLPDQALREKVIELFVNKTFLSEQNNNEALTQAKAFWTPAVIADMAIRTEGYSNRTLQGLVSGLYITALQHNGIRQQLVDDAIEQANKKMAVMAGQTANTQAA
jgi:ATPase family AAA domain-containing protein 3A/B